MAVDFHIVPGSLADGVLQVGVLRQLQVVFQLHESTLTGVVGRTRPRGIPHHVNAVAGVHDDGIGGLGIPVQEADFDGDAVLFSGVGIGSFHDRVVAGGLAAGGDGYQMDGLLRFSHGGGNEGQSQHENQYQRDEFLHSRDFLSLNEYLSAVFDR